MVRKGIGVLQSLLLETPNNVQKIANLHRSKLANGCRQHYNLRRVIGVERKMVICSI